jgi:hypothetical protein
VLGVDPGPDGLLDQPPERVDRDPLAAAASTTFSM